MMLNTIWKAPMAEYRLRTNRYGEDGELLSEEVSPPGGIDELETAMGVAVRKIRKEAPANAVLCSTSPMVMQMSLEGRVVWQMITEELDSG
jgi:hypothetical protein